MGPLLGPRHIISHSSNQAVQTRTMPSKKRSKHSSQTFNTNRIDSKSCCDKCREGRDIYCEKRRDGHCIDCANPLHCRGPLFLGHRRILPSGDTPMRPWQDPRERLRHIPPARPQSIGHEMGYGFPPEYGSRSHIPQSSGSQRHSPPFRPQDHGSTPHFGDCPIYGDPRLRSGPPEFYGPPSVSNPSRMSSPPRVSSPPHVSVPQDFYYHLKLNSEPSSPDELGFGSFWARPPGYVRPSAPDGGGFGSYWSQPSGFDRTSTPDRKGFASFWSRPPGSSR